MTNTLKLPTPSWWDDKLWGRVQDEPEVWELRNAETGELHARSEQTSPRCWRVSMPGVMAPCSVPSLLRAFEEVVYVFERKESGQCQK